MANHSFRRQPPLFLFYLVTQSAEPSPKVSSELTKSPYFVSESSYHLFIHFYCSKCEYGALDGHPQWYFCGSSQRKRLDIFVKWKHFPPTSITIAMACNRISKYLSILSGFCRHALSLSNEIGCENGSGTSIAATAPTAGTLRSQLRASGGDAIGTCEQG